jgi:dCMP deaminase
MRPTLDQTFMEVARAFAKRATCARRQVGAVITGGGYILSSGYNGSYVGSSHCIDSPCQGVNLPSGTGLDLCSSIHAEQNAVARLRNPNEADTIYCTTAPCVSCTKLILCTNIQRIVSDQDYTASGRSLWLQSGRAWDHYAE